MVNPTVRKILPIVNFVIATAALAFQVAILYPWHHQLEQRFNQMQSEQENRLKEYHQLKMESIQSIQSNLNELQRKKDK
jgi:Flp pilus assembly protein TadB